MQSTHYMHHMSVREVCPLHEATLEVCDCACTCGGAGPAGSCRENPACRLPDTQPEGFIRKRVSP